MKELFVYKSGDLFAKLLLKDDPSYTIMSLGELPFEVRQHLMKYIAGQIDTDTWREWRWFAR